jgi:hypothetical protein
VVLACDGVEACDCLFDPQRDESSPLLTPRGLPAKGDYRTNFSAALAPHARAAANAYRLW